MVVRNECTQEPRDSLYSHRSRDTRRVHYRHAAVASALLFGAACALNARPTLEPGTTLRMAELWNDDVRVESRDLYYGAGGRRLAPPADPHVRFVERDTRGASPGYDVRDANGMLWDVKLGPEARIEVVASRLLWAVGFHQPPTYYVPRWTLEGGPQPGPQEGGRFRPHRPEWRRADRWAWDRNPFVGTRELRGLFVLMVILNNWDLKASQNAIYETGVSTRVRRQYVVQDLGASLGRTRWWIPGTKGDIEGFSSEPFVTGVHDGIVDFHYRGAWRHPHLDDDVTPADVRWICGLLQRLSDRQWRDAFRAAGFEPDLASRFIDELRARVREGASISAADARTGSGRHRSSR
jgi:hypothetical protein